MKMYVTIITTMLYENSYINFIVCRKINSIFMIIKIILLISPVGFCLEIKMGPFLSRRKDNVFVYGWLSYGYKM